MKGNPQSMLNILPLSLTRSEEANCTIAFVLGKYLQPVLMGAPERCPTQVGKHLKWVEMLAGTEQAYLV